MPNVLSVKVASCTFLENPSSYESERHVYCTCRHPKHTLPLVGSNCNSWGLRGRAQSGRAYLGLESVTLTAPTSGPKDFAKPSWSGPQAARADALAPKSRRIVFRIMVKCFELMS